MTTENVNITIEDGGLGIAPLTADEVSAVIGTSSAGTANRPLVTTKIADLISTFGYGPMVEAAALTIQQTGAPVIAVKTPGTTAGVASAVAASGGGTSVMTVTGAPFDDYDVIVTCVKAGTIGAAGASIKISMDGGETESAEIALGTANTYAIPNTGLTLNFAAGTLVADCTRRFTCAAPVWGASDVQDAIGALQEGTNEFSFAHLVGAVDASDAVTFDLEMTGLATEYRYAGLLTHARDFESADTDAAGWRAAIAADFSSFASTRVSVAAGYYQIASPISGRKYRRPLSFAAAARLVARPISEDLGKVRTGSLAAVSTSSTDGKVYHDERVNPGLDAARFLTARTIIGRPGLYVTNGNMMSAPGSDFTWWQYRRIIDKACKIVRGVLLDYLGSSVRLNPLTGYILEKDALDLESRVRIALRDGLVAPGDVSAVSFAVSRTDNISSTKTINTTTRIQPLGYLKIINVSLGFTNPALQAAA